jgi:ectoine hydroxylase-related dioxygenase (phytanoyl-CoA dioxygenase family)
VSKAKEGSVASGGPSVDYSTSERLVQDFACRGLVVLSPESLGLHPEVHDRIYAREIETYQRGDVISPASIPDVLKILNSPGLVSACNQLIGENWAIVPFTHNAPFLSGAHDQHWHKDDNAPFNARKQRHHQSVQLEMLYFPQDVREDMGPTATIPYSHYWTCDHEENHDNFAGADHLDFNYVLSGMENIPVSGSDSKYSDEDIINARTAHDIRMRESVTKTGWPLVNQFEVAPLRAGSVVLYSHNTFHRGNHRRDDWRSWPDNPRCMWRFYLYRTTDTEGQPPEEICWDELGLDSLTRTDLSGAGVDLKAIWRHHYYWMKTGNTLPRSTSAGPAEEVEAERLYGRLLTKGEAAEPLRIGAAYRLAANGHANLALTYLARGLYDHRESVRRAATYGLVAMGSEATITFLEAITSPIKWIRKAGVYGLGDAAYLTKEVLDAVVTLLRADPSVYVRAVAAGTLGCLGRRAIATGVGSDLIPDCMRALVESLKREENRLGMDLAQGRSIKFVRPNDESDVCEGNGFDHGFERYEPVRSAVRENTLWSMVILCSHGSEVLGSELEETVDALKVVIREDKNMFSVGLAMDAMTRLASLSSGGTEEAPLIGELEENLRAILNEAPEQGWESLSRAGLYPEGNHPQAT